MITIENVSKSYSNVRAVDSLSFEARPGEIFGLIGPNGAGKSTTIRMIMNIIAPDSGRILFEGKPLAEADKARIGYLPEERGLYRKAKLGEVLEYLAAMVELKEKGATVLFSTHIMEHAEKICERILLVDKGKEVVCGPVADIKAKYGRNAVQLDFVVSVNAYPRWIEVVKLEAGGREEKKSEESFLQVLFTAMSFVMMLYMTVLLYGQLIGRSVVMEKTSKTVEIMLSSVTSRDLMFGKILGLGLALLAASVAGMAFLAAKVFRVGILMTGKRPKLKEILRWIAVK